MQNWQQEYQQTLEDMFAMLPMFQRVGAVAFKKDLGNTRALLSALGNPERDFKSIHIAGTNGKGSLTHMIGALLLKNGYRTGLYTSPHYRDFRERIKVGRKLIPPRYVIAFMRDHRSLIEKIQPSFFEVTVAMAFWYFSQVKVDFAVIETGMGGRLDSTNVLLPIMSVITNIGYDHMEFLGETLPEIAAEKAGIIKPHVPVVIGEEHPDTAVTFIEMAALQQAPLTFASRAFQVISRSPQEGGQQVLINERVSGALHQIETDLEGPYQPRNIVTYLESVRVLQQQGWLEPNDPAIIHVLRDVRPSTRFIGRWQTIRQHPRVLCDSAHNEAGLKALFSGLDVYTYDELHIVFGTVKDKDLSRIWPILPTSARYYFVQAQVPRAMEALLIEQEAAHTGHSGKSYTTVKGGLKAARDAAKPADLILVCGSIFVVAEVLPAR
ncbi:MAG: bifunctional folylpolyglutamate synthase/dihydrofolate synthase [Saprospiraceae bacterium]|nr:bifunctional folylpolyglutamate synthase/dihydrofolate synthase [Saprospiraceae bacterium]